jgi:hypothetical protein
MERAVPRHGFWAWFWSLLLLGLLAWHGRMTLQLFGPDQPWRHLTDDQPILTGRHPLHLYHGYLGARSFCLTGCSSCYDPAFDDGYPKTHVFDSGSRPAELFLVLAGGRYDPAAYKIGLAVCCLLVPLLVLMGCWGIGLGPAGSCLATAAGLMVWWSSPGRRALEAGDIDLLLAALAVLAHVGLLIRFDRQPGLLSWQGLLLTGCLGWFAHPVLFPILLPLLLIYYLSVGARHALSTWHLALALCELGGLAINAFWLTGWVRHWWLRQPLASNDAMLLHRTLATLWTAPQWGDHAERVLAAILLVSAVLGVVLFNQTGQRVTARLLGLGAGGLWVLAILGITWEPLGQLGTADLMVPALWFAALPAAHAWTQLYRLVVFLTRTPVRGAVVTCGLLAGLGYAGQELLESWAASSTEPPRLVLGLDAQRETLVKTLRETTTAEARILWEVRRDRTELPRWSALLPVLTGRSYVGGLDPYGTIEHTKMGLVDRSLGRWPVASYDDSALERYARQYNIGWVVCRSPEAVSRFRSWSGATETARLEDNGPVVLFTLTRAPRTFALKGRATVLHMDSHHITLADVVPEDGVVVLSLHYQTGLRAAPESVAVDKAPDWDEDVVPFVRLRMDRPVARVTLTWQGR